jgi:hypothetical protein
MVWFWLLVVLLLVVIAGVWWWRRDREPAADDAWSSDLGSSTLHQDSAGLLRERPDGRYAASGGATAGTGGAPDPDTILDADDPDGSPPPA